MTYQFYVRCMVSKSDRGGLMKVCFLFRSFSNLDLPTSWWVFSCYFASLQSNMMARNSSGFGYSTPGCSAVVTLGKLFTHVHFCYHGLRGSGSPVLTATGFVNGSWQFSTPTESTPLDRSPKNLLLVIMSATPTAVPNLVQIRPRGASGQMGEI